MRKVRKLRILTFLTFLTANFVSFFSFSIPPHCMRVLFSMFISPDAIGRINERVALSQRDPIAERVVSYS